METIIIKKGFYQMPMTHHKADGTVEETKGGFVEDYKGAIYLATYNGNMHRVIAASFSLDHEFETKINDYILKEVQGNTG